MRFRIGRDALAEAVAWVARALPARPVVPVLSGMLLEAAEGLTLSCFDYDVSARFEAAAEVTDPGSALVPGRLLAEITRSLAGDQAEFHAEPDAIALSCGAAEFTLVKLAVEEYPALPGLPPAAGTVDGSRLAAAVSQVATSASRDDTLPMLTGVFAEIDGDTITLAATDRYRLAVRRLSWDPARPGLRAAALIPARALADAARAMGPGGRVAISLRDPQDPGADGGPGLHTADGMIGFEGAGRRLTTRLLGGEFLRYSSRFPAEFGSRGEVAPGPLIEAVRRVSLVAERGSPVRLAFGDGEVVIEAGSQGQARAVERVPALFAGDERVIAFSPHYLLDGLTAAATPSPSPGPAAPDDPGGNGESAGRASTPGRNPAGIHQRRAARSHHRGAGWPGRIDGGSRPAAGDDSGAAGRDDSGTPDFRYLVVPLRMPGSS